MLLRILADNPGPTFTRNVDQKFVEATKDLLRGGRDPSVRQILMETLDTFETQKLYDEGLGNIIEMWKKEKEKAYKAHGVGYAPPDLSRCVPLALTLYLGTASTTNSSPSLQCERPLPRPAFPKLLFSQSQKQTATGPRRADQPTGRSTYLSQAPRASCGLHTTLRHPLQRPDKRVCRPLPVRLTQLAGVHDIDQPSA